MQQTYSTLKEYERRMNEITEAGWDCSDAEADVLLMERKKLHAEMHEFFPEYFKVLPGRVRHKVR